MPANRMSLSDRIKKLTDTIRIHVKKPYGENKDDVELHEVVDNGNVIATFLKRDGEILQSNASPDLQQSGLDEKVNKAVGAKKGDTTSTTPVESAKDTKGAKQMAPERPKEHEGHEAEGKEKIKAPDSKEKKTKEPKEAKKPDNSMSKMASAESAETQGAAPLEKNYNIKRVGDTLHYTRLGEENKNKMANPAVVPPHATQTPNQVATKAPATGPNKPQGTGASPQQPPAPATTAAPSAKQPPNQRWKALFQARQKERQASAARKAGAEVMGRKGKLFVKSEPEEFENTPGNRKRAKDEYEQDRKNYGKDLHEKENQTEPLKKDGVEFKKAPCHEVTKPILVRDLNRLKGHTQSGRPFRVMLATHEDHSIIPGYHMSLDQEHSASQIKKHLSNPIHPITKAVYAALERGHDKLIVHNPKQPFKAVK
jgi:hypothetical protein